MTKAFKYLLSGLLVNVGIIVIASVHLVVTVARSYKGRCGVFWFFGGQGRPCPLLEYMKEEVGFELIALLQLWWLILPAFAVIPVIGYLIGRNRSRL